MQRLAEVALPPFLRSPFRRCREFALSLNFDVFLLVVETAAVPHATRSTPRLEHAAAGERGPRPRLITLQRLSDSTEWVDRKDTGAMKSVSLKAYRMFSVLQQLFESAILRLQPEAVSTKLYCHFRLNSVRGCVKRAKKLLQNSRNGNVAHFMLSV